MRAVQSGGRDEFIAAVWARRPCRSGAAPCSRRLALPKRPPPGNEVAVWALPLPCRARQ